MHLNQNFKNQPFIQTETSELMLNASQLRHSSAAPQKNEKKNSCFCNRNELTGTRGKRHKNKNKNTPPASLYGCANQTENEEVASFFDVRKRNICLEIIEV